MISQEMPSGWNIYYIVFLSAIFALAIPLALRLLSSFFSSQEPDRKAEIPSISGDPMSLGQRINTRFFKSANVALLLIAFGLILIPCALIARSPDGAALILSTVGFSALGLLYSARKGDLEWLRTFVRRDDRS